MKPEEETLLLIKGVISELPAAEKEACEELAEHIQRMIVSAGPVVGSLALALVGAKAQAEA